MAGFATGLVVLGAEGVSDVVALAVALAGVIVGDSVVTAGLAGVSCGPMLAGVSCGPMLAGVSCGPMLVGVDGGSGLAVVSDSPPGMVCCCLGGSLMPIDRSVSAGACGFLLPAAGSPPEVIAGFSSSLSDSYMVRCTMGG